jgi:fumarate reductase subunit D
MISGMLMPALLLMFGIAFPLGLLTAPTYEQLAALLGNPLTRLVLFSLCALSFFHFAHRFRHTLYDGLQIKHLNEIVAVLSYGAAIVGSGLAAYLLWQLG